MQQALSITALGNCSPYHGCVSLHPAFGVQSLVQSYSAFKEQPALTEHLLCARLTARPGKSSLDFDLDSSCSFTTYQLCDLDQSYSASLSPTVFLWIAVVLVCWGGHSKAPDCVVEAAQVCFPTVLEASCPGSKCLHGFLSGLSPWLVHGCCLPSVCMCVCVCPSLQGPQSYWIRALPDDLILPQLPFKRPCL